MTEPTRELLPLPDLEKRLDELLRTFETVMLTAFTEVDVTVRDTDGRFTAVALRTLDGKRAIYARKQVQPKGNNEPHFRLVPLKDLSLRGKITLSRHLDELIREAHKSEQRLYADTEAAIELVEAALAILRG